MNKAINFINERPLTLNKINKSYNCMDLAKFICALLIIVIHTSPLIKINEAANYMLNNWICRLAVPFFFMSTGFLLFRKTDLCNMQRSSVVAFTKKILSLYFIWSIIHIPISFYELFKLEKNPVLCLFKYCRNIIFSGSYYSLWYLPAVVVAVWLTYFSLKYVKKFKIIIPCASLLYAVGMLLLTYRKILKLFLHNPEILRLLSIAKKLFVTTRNGIFFGFIFVVLGALFAYKPIKINMKKATAFFLLSVALLFAEVMLSYFRFNTTEPDMWIMLLPSSFFLFYIVTHIELKDSGKYIAMRKMSSLIYFGHRLIIFGIMAIGETLHSEALSEGLLQWFIVTVLSVAVSYSIIKLSQKSRFKFLKKLYA